MIDNCSRFRLLKLMSVGIRGLATSAGLNKRSNNDSSLIDSLRILAKGGNGGEGLPKKGGFGGKGGDVVLHGKKDMTLKTLKQKFPRKRFKASSGENSRFFALYGKEGSDCTIPVPLGITAYNDEHIKIGEINTENDRLIIATGGQGGNNLNGYSSQKGQSHIVKLDLTIVADVGFVGFPNAGKSTLLRAISNSRPKVASYPFTTIRPNVGVLEYKDGRSISCADLPGLIEGAHVNVGMGHRFLKHVERTRLLLFVVDIHGFQLSSNYQYRSGLETISLLNKELELYRPDLIQKPCLLALNKADLPNSFEEVMRIRDVVEDEDSYQHYLESLPEEIRPEQAINFSRVATISAAKDKNSVLILKDIIRSEIDLSQKEKLREESFLTGTNGGYH